VLCIGDTLAYFSYPTPNTPPFNTGTQVMSVPCSAFEMGTPTYTSAYAQFKASSIIVLRVGLDSTQAASLYNLLKTRAGI
jgi:hypothetical protein